MNLVQRTTETIRKHGLIAPGARMLVAVSGGADSVALLRLLNDLRPAWRLVLTAAHLNHCIRGRESDDDELFVRELAEQLGIRCISERVDIPAAVAAEGCSLEEAARRERYAFLGRAAAAVNAGVIATGHNRNDQAETVLQRVLTGTGLRGLRGIPPARPLATGSSVSVVRPLIEADRSEILEYLNSIGQKFRTDSSNSDTAYLRNRLRHGVLPELERQAGPGVEDALIRLAETARKQYNVIETLARDLIARARLSDDCLALDQALLAGAHPELATEAIRLALEDAGARRLSYDHCRSLTAMPQAETGAELSLPGGFLLRAEYGTLRLVRPADLLREPPHDMTMPVPGAVVYDGISLSAGPAPRPVDLKCADRMIETLDADVLRPPLTVRRRRPGDRFHPLGSTGSRKLHDFFIDEKVPAFRRDHVPIVCDRAGIVWVAGYRLDHRVRITDSTRRVVELRMDSKGERNG